MNSTEQYNKAFMDLFNVSEEQLKDLKYQDVNEWDSVGHMELIARLEDDFDIMMDTDDIIDFSSYEKGKEILSNNYDIEF